MSRPTPMYATLDEWIAREATPFSVDSPTTFNAAIDKVIASLGDAVELLGFGEALHGGEDILILPNRLFQRLVEAHGYSAMAIESSFPRAPMRIRQWRREGVCLCSQKPPSTRKGS